MTPRELWDRYQRFHCEVPSIGLTLDASRVPFTQADLDALRPRVLAAFDAMDALETGAIANPDENRMVGHYWLRDPDRAPTAAISQEIRQALVDLKTFTVDVHSGRVRPQKAPKFTRAISIGIGGSALGPMFVADALGDPATDPVAMHFVDNTDPDGIDRLFRAIGDGLRETMTIVMTKSGGTPETRNGMLLVADAYRRAGLDFTKHAVAVTMAGSKMDQQAVSEGWLARFPMWDWVGGRTSELSAVGLLPGLLQGIDVEAMLAGARDCDAATRVNDPMRNPAALMAQMWHIVTSGRGAKDLVVLPYSDRLLLFSRYLQQLVMESLGKRLDLHGQRVDQGLTVYGNKGSTDQHAYVQQLRDGVNNFFVTFIRVLSGRGDHLEVDPGTTAGDYLQGFLLGTREALFDNDRPSLTLTIPRVDARTVGALIALFERTVGFYASLVGINAYHQPGVEAGKKAAATVLALQGKVAAALTTQPQTADEVAAAIGQAEAAESAYLLLERLAARGAARNVAGDRPGNRSFVAP